MATSPISSVVQSVSPGGGTAEVGHEMGWKMEEDLVVSREVDLKVLW